MVKKYSYCRLCGDNNLSKILDFGETALANSYVCKEDVDKEEFKAPLEVAQCKTCGSTQLMHTVDSSKLFSNYSYASSDSKMLQEHFNEYAKSVFYEFELTSESTVIDIGSNDGVLLEPFKDLGVKVIGIEPATNLCEKSEARGCRTINGFFTPELVITHELKADIITCNNCFAHIDSLSTILSGIHLALKDNGTFIFENAYWLDSVANKYFDQVYHEHIFYHSIKPLSMFLNRNGFYIDQVERNTIQGGTIRVFCKKGGAANNNKIVSEMIAKEESFGLYNVDFYKEFRNELDRLQASLKQVIIELKKRGETFSGYGAPAKATLFCKFFGFDKSILEYIVDDSPLKHGKLMPETHIPIVNNQYFKENPTNYTIIMAWNFSEAIRLNNPQYKGSWITPMPTALFHD